MKRILLATTALAAFATTAFAADIPAARMPAKAPAHIAAYNWTGFYAGVNLGGAWTNSLSGSNTSGVIGGAQVGMNWQAGGSPFVFGVETDFQGSSQRSTTNLPWFGTVRGRLGYAWDRTMLYATGGFAYQNFQATGANSTGTGWTVGGGVEWAFYDRWSAKGEYLYIDTDGGSQFVGRGRNNVLRAGVNYRF